MKKVFDWAVRVAALLLFVKVALWSWQQFQASRQDNGAGAVQDWEMDCEITNPDTGQCVCFHRRTGDRLVVAYEKCADLAGRQ